MPTEITATVEPPPQPKRPTLYAYFWFCNTGRWRLSQFPDTKRLLQGKNYNIVVIPGFDAPPVTLPEDVAEFLKAVDLDFDSLTHPNKARELRRKYGIVV